MSFAEGTCEDADTMTRGGTMRSIKRSGAAVALAGSMVVAGVGLAMAQDDPIEVAYLSASSANTWLGASKAAMDEVAAANGITITEFDAQFDPALQTTQLQDAIAANRYDGMIVVALAGSAVIPDLEAAAEAGMKIVGLNQVIGDDFTTADPQTPVLSASVMEPPFQRGERIGRLTLMACDGLDPCDVVYFYGIKGIPLDVAVRQGFDSVVEGSTVNIVAEGEGQYLGPDAGLAAMQDILVSTPEFDVVVGADQSMQGAEIALTDAGILDQVKIIGFGGSSVALDAVKEGRWFGELVGAPATEGRLAMEALVEAFNGTDIGGVDPALTMPDEGLMTAENADLFTAEWDG
jgi:ribose transport system substrate-binding protein